HPRWSRPIPRPVRYVSRQERCQSLSRSCMVYGGFILDGHSCIRHENSETHCSVWCNVPMTLHSLSSPTLLLGGRGSTWVSCLLHACTWRKPSHATRQTNDDLRCSALASIRALAADSMPLRPSGSWDTRSKPWHASTKP